MLFLYIISQWNKVLEKLYLDVIVELFYRVKSVKFGVICTFLLVNNRQEWDYTWRYSYLIRACIKSQFFVSILSHLLFSY